MPRDGQRRGVLERPRDDPVSRVEPGGDDLLVELTRRYLPAGRVDAFLDYARSELGSQLVIAMTPQHWLSADLGEA